MKVFVISIVMWWANPFDNPWPHNDTVEIQTYNGKPLYFKTVDQCFEHIDQNLQNLIQVGHSHYPSATDVNQILCVERYKSET